MEKILNDAFEKLMEKNWLLFPSQEISEEWDVTLHEWMNDERLPLFVRRPSALRGSQVANNFGRKLIITDNTPAHWVFRTIVLDKKRPDLNMVANTIDAGEFPLAMMMKKTEKAHMQKAQVATRAYRLGQDEWKIAHIEPVALSRKKNLELDDYVDHHYKLLSLKNMYLINKAYAGIAEVKQFNEIVAARTKQSRKIDNNES
jgi:hypothetical protein